MGLIKGEITAGQFTMDYFRFGDGDRVLVILPGVSVKPVVESANAVEKEYSVMEHDFTIYVIDRRRQIPEGYTIKDMASDTVEAIRWLGLNDICLFGASQGGMIAMQIAVDHPELIRALVLGSSSARVTQKQYDSLRRWIELARKGDGEGLYLQFGKDIYPQEFYTRYEKALKLLGGSLKAEEMEHFALLCEAVKGFDILEDLDRIKCPVLVLGSKDDNVLGAQASEEIAMRLKAKGRTDIHMYEGYGHAAFDTAPDYQKRMLDFLVK